MSEYYTSYAPMADLLATGNPVLTYHKLGPRPRGVRLKGLYVGRSRFRRQLLELKRAGYASGRLEDCPVPRTAARVVITFDDGYINALEHGLPALREAGFRAIQFLPVRALGGLNSWDVVEGEAPERIMDVARVRDWLAAGHEIGSHTLTHPHLTQLPTAAAREEITASRRWLEDTFGLAVRHFCYPYGDWNAAVRDLVIEAGYTTACTTEAGVNGPGADPWSLKRFTARYPSRNWRTFRAWLGSWWAARRTVAT